MEMPRPEQKNGQWAFRNAQFTIGPIEAHDDSNDRASPVWNLSSGAMGCMNSDYCVGNVCLMMSG
jgi:hypothetical protein